MRKKNKKSTFCIAINFTRILNYPTKPTLKKRRVNKKTKERAARVEEEEVTFNSDNFPHSDKTKPTLLLFLSFFL